MIDAPGIRVIPALIKWNGHLIMWERGHWLLSPKAKVTLLSLRGNRGCFGPNMQTLEPSRLYSIMNAIKTKLLHFCNYCWVSNLLFQASNVDQQASSPSSWVTEKNLSCSGSPCLCTEPRWHVCMHAVFVKKSYGQSPDLQQSYAAVCQCDHASACGWCWEEFDPGGWKQAG